MENRVGNGVPRSMIVSEDDTEESSEDDTEDDTEDDSEDDTGYKVTMVGIVILGVCIIAMTICKIVYHLYSL